MLDHAGTQDSRKMPHRLLSLSSPIYTIGGLITYGFVAAHQWLVAQAPIAGVGGDTMTEVVGSGSIAIVAISTLRFLADIWAKDRAERRKAATEKDERDHLEEMARIARDNRIAEIERKARDAEDKARDVEDKAQQVAAELEVAKRKVEADKVEVDESRERNHKNLGRFQDVLSNLMVQVAENTEVAAAFRDAIHQIDPSIPLPSPVENYLAAMKPPEIVTKPTAAEIAKAKPDPVNPYWGNE